jgi:hypothetical protein
MPRIPRRSKGTEKAPTPQEQRTDGDAPSTDPPTQRLSSGDPLATTPGPPAPAADQAPASGDPLAEATPPTAPHGATAVDGAPPTQALPADPGDQPTVAAPVIDPATAGAAPAVDRGDATATAVAASDAAPDAQPEQAPVDARPRFRERTRMRRRLRYLRRLRELAFRDLGGLVFDLHRFGRDRSDLVAAKLEALATIDRELRALQDALADRREFTDLREAGIAACPRCGTLHDTDANFCPGCGTSLRTSVVRDAAPVSVTPADEPAAPPRPAAGPPGQHETTATGS